MESMDWIYALIISGGFMLLFIGLISQTTRGSFWNQLGKWGLVISGLVSIVFGSKLISL